jgi:hypothetical protein
VIYVCNGAKRVPPAETTVHYIRKNGFFLLYTFPIQTSYLHLMIVKHFFFLFLTKCQLKLKLIINDMYIMIHMV